MNRTRRILYALINALVVQRPRANSNLVLAVMAAGALVPTLARGQVAVATLPPPPTLLESFETNVGAVILKGSTEVGTVSCNNGVVSVKCREMTDTTTGHRERGLAIEITVKGSAPDRMLIDYDEFGPLLNGIDFLNKVDVSVTSLNAFDAAYTTKGGFRIAAMGARRVGAVQFAMRDVRNTMVPVILSRDEMARFCALLDQARKQLEILVRNP